MKYFICDFFRKLPFLLIGTFLLFFIVSPIDTSLFQIIERVTFFRIGGSPIIKFVPLYHILLLYFITSEPINMYGHFKAELLIRYRNRKTFVIKLLLSNLFYNMLLTLSFLLSWVIFTIFFKKVYLEIAYISLFISILLYFLQSFFFTLLISYLTTIISEEKALLSIFLFGLSIIVIDFWSLLLSSIESSFSWWKVAFLLYFFGSIFLTFIFIRKGKKLEGYDGNST